MTKYRIVKLKYKKGFYYSVQRRVLGIFWREIDYTYNCDTAQTRLLGHKRFEELPKKEIVYEE